MAICCDLDSRHIQWGINFIYFKSKTLQTFCLKRENRKGFSFVFDTKNIIFYVPILLFDAYILKFIVKCI